MTSSSDFIRRLTNPVVDSVKGFNLFPSVIMAQAILESGWGKSELASVYKNLFGIKAGKAWKGPVVDMATREVINDRSVYINDLFRVYDNVADSVRDRNRFLKQNPRYAKAGVFTARTPEEQATALQNAGYATDPGYAAALIRLIRVHNLKSLDEIAKKKEPSA